jgi:hypothetical protein
MEQTELSFVIPTFRLRDVGETVEAYDEHFWRNGHSVPITVFDDSSPANQEKYFPLLEQTRTHNDLFYVGPQEKGTVYRVPEPAAERQAARASGQEPVPAELRRQPQLYAHVHVGRIDGEL